MNFNATLTALRRYGGLVVVVGLMALVFAMGWHGEFTLENIVLLRDRFHAFLDRNLVLSVLGYVAIYAAAVALSLPVGLVLTLAGGLLFGWLIGAAAAVIGATTGATIVFLIARTALGGFLRQRASPWLAKLSHGFCKDALSYLLFLRLVPAFPFWLVNLAPALLGVPLRTYVIATFFGILPATLAFASAGAGLDSVVASAKAEYAACVASNGEQACKLTLNVRSLFTNQLLLALVLLGLVALIPVVVKRWRTRNAAAE
jgi:uncharacterized membrane protein YdjX (TVP38/TMEM64 family)